MKISDFKPCPFCGGTDVFTTGIPYVSACCGTCGAQTGRCGMEATAIDVWNSRPAPEPWHVRVLDVMRDSGDDCLAFKDVNALTPEEMATIVRLFPAMNRAQDLLHWFDAVLGRADERFGKPWTEVQIVRGEADFNHA